jgi:hypothetical protein
MKKQKITQKILLGMFLMWIIAAGTKSLIHLKRTVNEVLVNINSSKEFFPEIKPCQPKPVNLSEEESHLWEYRNMGVKCKK